MHLIIVFKIFPSCSTTIAVHLMKHSLATQGVLYRALLVWIIYSTWLIFYNFFIHVYIYRVSHFRALEIFSLNWYAFVNFIDLGAKIALVCNIVEFYYCMCKILSSMNKLQYWKKNIVFQCCVLYILHTVCYKSTFICRLNYTCTVH